MRQIFPVIASLLGEIESRLRFLSFFGWKISLFNQEMIDKLQWDCGSKVSQLISLFHYLSDSLHFILSPPDGCVSHLRVFAVVCALNKNETRLRGRKHIKIFKYNFKQSEQ